LKKKKKKKKKIKNFLKKKKKKKKYSQISSQQNKYFEYNNSEFGISWSALSKISIFFSIIPVFNCWVDFENFNGVS